MKKCLDLLDFGVKTVDDGVPRIVAWRGDMIKVFSELDREGKNMQDANFSLLRFIHIKSFALLKPWFHFLVPFFGFFVTM